MAAAGLLRLRVDTVEERGARQSKITVTYRFSQPDQPMPVVRQKCVRRVQGRDPQTNFAAVDTILIKYQIPLGIPISEHLEMESPTQKSRSKEVSTGRFRLRWKAAS